MSAFIPNRRDPEITAQAIPRVHEDRRREATDGFDGTWVAHPGLVATAREEFDAVLGDRPNQVDRLRPEVDVSAADLLDVRSFDQTVTTAIMRLVTLQDEFPTFLTIPACTHYLVDTVPEREALAA